MKIWLLAMGAIVFAGCSIQTVAPATTEYRLEPDSIIQKAQKSSCSEQSIKVARLQTSDNYMGRSIYYGEGEMKQFSYAYARWAQPLSERVGKIFESSLRDSGYFRSVISYKTLLPTTYVLEINLGELMQHFRADGTSYVHLEMDLLLLNKNGSVISDVKHISLIQEAPTADVEGGIKAMNTLLGKAQLETNSWLGGKCE